MSVLRLNPDVVSWREVDGEILALDHGASAYLSTNASGALLWKSLVHGSSREALVELLAVQFDVDEAQAAADVDVFLSDLAVQGLLAA